MNKYEEAWTNISKNVLGINLSYSKYDLITIEELIKGATLMKPIDICVSPSFLGKCPSCDKKIDRDFAFCPYCGQAIDWSEEE